MWRFEDGTFKAYKMRKVLRRQNYKRLSKWQLQCRILIDQSLIVLFATATATYLQWSVSSIGSHGWRTTSKNTRLWSPTTSTVLLRFWRYHYCHLGTIATSDYPILFPLISTRLYALITSHNGYAVAEHIHVTLQYKNIKY